MWHEFGKMKSLQFGPCPIWYHWGTGFMTCSAPTTRGQVSCFGFIYDNSDKLKENVWSFCINSKDNQYNTVSLKIRRYNNEPWFPFKHGHKESQLAAVFPFLSSSLCLSPQRKKNPANTFSPERRRSICRATAASFSRVHHTAGWLWKMMHSHPTNRFTQAHMLKPPWANSIPLPF